MDLQQAYQEAFDALDDKKYASAHQQFDWLLENAEKLDPAFRGVRASYGLSGWLEVAKHYPPAMERLIELHHQALERFHQTGEPEAFRDFASLSHYLEKQEDVLSEFSSIAKTDKSLARLIFNSVYDFLVAGKHWHICAEFLDEQMIGDKYDLSLHCFDQIALNNEKLNEKLSAEQKATKKKNNYQMLEQQLTDLLYCLTAMPTKNLLREYKGRASTDLAQRDLSELFTQLEKIT